MRVNELLSRISNDCLVKFTVVYCNELGTEVEASSEFKEFVYDHFGDYMIDGEESIFVYPNGSGAEVKIYVSKE